MDECETFFPFLAYGAEPAYITKTSWKCKVDPEILDAEALFAPCKHKWFFVRLHLDF
jgi:hypothetical protein